MATASNTHCLRSMITQKLFSRQATSKIAPFPRKTFSQSLVQPMATIGVVACKGQASTSSAEMETKLAGGIASIAQAKVVRLGTPRMLMLPLALGLKVSQLQRRWELVGQTTLQAEKGRARQTA